MIDYSKLLKKIKYKKLRRDNNVLHGGQYKKAFELMQKEIQTSFDSMVYIGDNIKKDVLTPKKLGFKCIYFDNVDGLY